MQIFHPYASWYDSAQYLKNDYKRLGKQVVELSQVYGSIIKKIMDNEQRGWFNHPITQHIYHKGNPYNLFPYIKELNNAWFELGYRRSEEFLTKLEKQEELLTPFFTQESYVPFYAYGDERTHEGVYEKYRQLLEHKQREDKEKGRR